MRQESAAKALQVCPEEITILTETVRMFQDLESSPGRVAFIREYYPMPKGANPDDYQEELDRARKVFCAAFGSGSKFDVENPMYLTEPRDTEVMRKGLLRRFLSLRAQLVQMNTETPDGRTEEKKQVYGHLLELKKLIEGLEANLRTGKTVSSYDASGKILPTTALLETEEQMNELVEKFMFLVLQAKEPRPDWKEKQGSVEDPQVIVDLVGSVDLEGVAVATHENIPAKFKEWFSGIVAEDANLEKLYDALYGMVRAIIEAQDDNTEYLERLDTINGKEQIKERYDELLKFIDLILNTFIGNIKSLQEDLDAARTQNPSNNTQLEAQLRTLNAKIAELQSQLDKCRREKAAAEAALAAASETAAAAPTEAQQKVEDMTETIAALEAQLTEITNQVNGLQDKHEQQTKDVEIKDKRLQGYQKVLNNFRDSMLALRKQYLEKEGALTAANALLEAKDAAITKTSKDLEDLRARLATLNGSKTELDETHANLNRQLQELQTTHQTQLQKKEAELESKLAGLKLSHTAEIQTILEKLQNSQDEKQKTMSDIRRLEAQRSRQLLLIQEIQAILPTLDTKIKSLEAKQESLKPGQPIPRGIITIKKQIEQKKAAYQTTLNNLIASNQKLEEQITIKEAEQTAREKEINDANAALQAQIEQKEEELRATTKSYGAALEAQKAEAAKKLLAQKVAMEAAFAVERKKLESERKAVEDALTKEKADRATEKAELETQIELKQTELETQAKTFAEDTAKLKADFAAALQAKDLEVSKYRNVLEQTTALLRARTDELQVRTNAAEEKGRAVDAVRAELNEKTAEVERLGAEAEVARQDLARLQAALATAEGEKAAADQAKAACEAAMRDLQARQAAFQAELNAANQARERLETELATFRERTQATVQGLQGQLLDSQEVAQQLRDAAGTTGMELARVQGQLDGMRAAPPPPRPIGVPGLDNYAVQRTRDEASGRSKTLLTYVESLVTQLRARQTPYGVPASLGKLSGRLQAYTATTPNISNFCALNFMVNTFIELLFLSPATPTKISMRSTLENAVRQYLTSNQVQNVGPIVLAYSNALQTFEKAPATRPPPTQALVALYAAISSMSEAETFGMRAIQMFSDAFPEFSSIASQVGPSGLPYALEFLVFLTLSKIYLKRISKQLTAERCTVAEPAAPPVGLLPAPAAPPLLEDDQRLRRGSQLEALGEPPAARPPTDYELLGVTPSSTLEAVARQFQIRAAAVYPRPGAEQNTQRFEALVNAYARIRAELLGKPAPLQIEFSSPANAREKIPEQAIVAAPAAATSGAATSGAATSGAATSGAATSGAAKRNATRRRGALAFNQGEPVPTAVPGKVSRKTARLQRQGYKARQDSLAIVPAAPART